MEDFGKVMYWFDFIKRVPFHENYSCIAAKTRGKNLLVLNIITTD